MGNRSIIGDPRSSTMQKELNLKIKFGKALDLLPAILEADKNGLS